jgi:hypothetical protein
VGAVVRSPKFEPGSSAWQAQSKLHLLTWPANRGEFLEYLQSKRYNARYAQCILSYLDKNVRELREPMDIVRIFAKLSLGQQYNLNRACESFTLDRKRRVDYAS